MKCISLWQPFASLIACGAKIHETRHWATSYRGPLLIHAAKRRMDRETWEFFRSSTCQWSMYAGDSDGLSEGLAQDRAEALPYGAALCVVNLTACIPTEQFHKTGSRLPADEPFGNFAPGRFAWRLENLRVLPEPIPMRGQQGLFDVPADVLEKVNAALAGKAVA